jgi:RecA/RadA recombinase
MGAVPTALIVRGPPGSGKSTLVDSLVAQRKAAGQTCEKVHLDDGWNPGEVHRQPAATAATRYPSLVLRRESLLVVDLALAEPAFAQTDELGASRRPREWVALLQRNHDVLLVRLRARWATCEPRILAREGRIAWWHVWGHAVIQEDAWRFAERVGLSETLVDAERPAAAVLADVAKLLPP